MPKDNRVLTRKVRERMAQTGERYTVALRKLLDAGDNTEPMRPTPHEAVSAADAVESDLKGARSAITPELANADSAVLAIDLYTNGVLLAAQHQSKVMSIVSDAYAAATRAHAMMTPSSALLDMISALQAEQDRLSAMYAAPSALTTAIEAVTANQKRMAAIVSGSPRFNAVADLNWLMGALA